MTLLLNRREFIGKVAIGSAAAYCGLNTGISFSSEPPPEINTLRMRFARSACWAPQHVAKREKLFLDEGFTNVEFKDVKKGGFKDQLLHAGETDLNIGFSARQLYHAVPGDPTVFISGLHAGCYSLIASEHIKSIRDLKGKKVWAWTNLESGPAIFFKTIISYVGLDPNNDVEYVKSSKNEAIELFKRGKIDAFMSFPPGPQQLKDEGVGKVLVDTNMDRPWSQYFCCTVTGNRNFIKKYPIATKRALRAILRANDIISKNPEIGADALIEQKVRKESEKKYIVQALRDIPYGEWRNYHPEDTIRFYMLRLREIGMTQYSPKEIITQNTNWTFLESLKNELGMLW